MTYQVLETALAALRDVAAGTPATAMNNPTPCEAWSVGQVLFHAAADQHAWAATVGGGALPTYNPFDPPRSHDDGVEPVVEAAVRAAMAAWAEVTGEAVPTPLPPVPTLPAGLAAAACALDAAVHAWDVAVATGQDSPLSAELAEQLMPAAQATVEPLRGFAYAPALQSEPSDDAAAALLRYLGRHPNWTP